MTIIAVNELTKNSPSVEHMTPIMYNRIPVITTELLADVYETDVINIQVNHSRNKARFVAGKHFFKIAGQELKDLRLTLSKSQNLLVTSSNPQISSKTRSLILWTERGAARHAKMLDTDKAWDVFERLEDYYFNQKSATEVKTKPRLPTATQLTPLRQTAERLITTGLGKIYPDIWKLVHEHFEVKHIYQLSPEQITEAVEFLNVLEGEYIGKEELLTPQSTKVDLSVELNNISVIYNYLCKITEIWRESISPALELVNSPITSEFRVYLKDAFGAAYSTKRAIEKKVELLD
ncbi:ORF6N domain-containing protein [Xenorhabdus griffiniae]|uniref:ORF6N domain-containing protein n=1 Tax=Xenorhabdus griffiniae TaxID=351672 RepID=UPI0030CA72E6